LIGKPKFIKYNALLDINEELWKKLEMTIGAETMLDCIYAWASADEIEQWIKWFEEEGYFGEY
jgi:hypothetical protein